MTGLRLPPARLLRYAGRLTQQSRSAEALEGLLSDYFDGLPVHIEQCIGRWVVVGEADRIVLGARNKPLGLNATIGGRVFDRAGKFRISLGHKKLAEFVRFLPDGEDFQVLQEIVQLFLVDALEFEVELTLPGAEVPRLCLSSSKGTRLGRASWLTSQPFSNNVSVIFQASE